MRRSVPLSEQNRIKLSSLAMARVQECHLIAGHTICDLVEIAF